MQRSEKLNNDSAAAHPGWESAREVSTMTSEVMPPGKAHIMPCPDCRGSTGQSCYVCHGTGSILMRACPLCGDPGWDYTNGLDDHDGMACRLGCGYQWSATDPGWRAQVMPDNAA